MEGDQDKILQKVISNCMDFHDDTKCPHYISSFNMKRMSLKCFTQLKRQGHYLTDELRDHVDIELVQRISLKEQI